MSALSSAELRRRADAVDKLGKSWAVRMEPNETRALADELDRYELLRRAVNESGDECLSGCNSLAHEDACKNGQMAATLINQQRMLDQDQEALKVAEEALYRLTNEVACLYAFEEAVRALIGNTNWNVLIRKRDEAIDAIAVIRARRKG